MCEKIFKFDFNFSQQLPRNFPNFNEQLLLILLAVQGVIYCYLYF